MRHGFLLLLLCVPVRAHAMFIDNREPMPLDRILVNLGAYVRHHQDDASGHYQLGRAYYLALMTYNDTLKVAVQGDDENRPPIYVADADSQRDNRFYKFKGAAERLENEQGEPVSEMNRDAENIQRELDMFSAAQELFRLRVSIRMERLWRSRRKQLDDATRERYAIDAANSLTEAVRLMPEKGLYRLTLASLIDVSLEDMPVLRAFEQSSLNGMIQNQAEQPVPADDLITRYRELAISFYEDAYELTYERDLDANHYYHFADFVSVEAMERYVRLVRQRNIKPEEQRQIEVMRDHAVELHKLPLAITPIVMTLRRADSLDALLTDTPVTFDLDGDGVAEPWSWVAPDTGILVWDPFDTGRITSGRQLFGNATWWLLFTDGYRALDALDDNRDGELTGLELRGLAVWFDRDTDGVSDPGEVVPIRDLPVAAIATRPTSREGDVLTHPAGLRLNDGRELPTWDWIAERR